MLKRAIGRGCRAAPATKSTAQQPDQRTTSNVGTRRSGTTSPLRRLWARLQNVDLDLLRPDLFCLRELHFEHPGAEVRAHSPTANASAGGAGGGDLPRGGGRKERPEETRGDAQREQDRRSQNRAITGAAE